MLLVIAGHICYVYLYAAALTLIFSNDIYPLYLAIPKVCSMSGTIWPYRCGEITFSLCFFISDFYEEVLALIFSMTCTHISPPLWQVFQMMYDTFQDDMYDYFVGK